jgi:DNA-binding GntR family transcriptional regulator
METLSPAVVAVRRDHLVKVMGQRLTPLRVEKLETELHVHTVLAKANRQIVDTIRRSHLVVIPTHSTFAAQPHLEEIGQTLEEHLEIYDLILDRKKRAATQALEGHVRRALETNVKRLNQLGSLPDSLRPPFLQPA